MRAPRPLAILLILTLVGCSGGDADGPDDATSTTSTTTAKSAAGPVGSSTTAPSQGSDAGTGGAGAAVNADPAARAALDHYLDALGANDFAAAVSASRDGMQALAVVRSIVHASNAEAGGTTTSRFDERTITPTAASSNEVRFGGKVSLTSTVSGPGAAPETTTDRLGDFVVRNDGAGWKVADASYNARSVVHHPATASATAGSVEVRLTGALAFGNSVAVVAHLVASGEHEVAVRSESLRVGDEAASSMTRVVVGGQPGSLYAAYPRRDDRPSEWRLTLTIDGTDHQLVLRF